LSLLQPCGKRDADILPQQFANGPLPEFQARTRQHGHAARCRDSRSEALAGVLKALTRGFGRVARCIERIRRRFGAGPDSLPRGIASAAGLFERGQNRVRRDGHLAQVDRRRIDLRLLGPLQRRTESCDGRAGSRGALQRLRRRPAPAG
jgi:hypothetical protein